jgi:hypothetical protein
MHRLLESTPVPVISTANNIRVLGPAEVRRMTMCVRMKVPHIAARTRLWQRMGEVEGVVLAEPEAARLARLVPAARCAARDWPAAEQRQRGCSRRGSRGRCVANRCPAAQTLRPSGLHTRNRAIRYRTTACGSCALKPKCTPGAQRTIHRLVDQSALDRMEARIHANPSLMTIRRCTVEHPFSTIKRMSNGGRFLTRGLRAVKAEAALSILAFNLLHAVNAFGTAAITPS